MRRLEWDHKYRFFRFDHHWHYLLRGEIGEFPETNVKVGKFDFISIACAVDTEAGPYLYVGILDAFYFSRSGDLDLLVLTLAMRQPIDPVQEDKSEGESEGESEDQPSDFSTEADYLYLKYSEVKDVSIRYVSLPDDSPPT